MLNSGMENKVHPIYRSDGLLIATSRAVVKDCEIDWIH